MAVEFRDLKQIQHPGRRRRTLQKLKAANGTIRHGGLSALYLPRFIGPRCFPES
jgi:hypothetical protein